MALTKTIQTRFNILQNWILEPYYKDTCQYCGKPFNKGYKTEKYCCDDCRKKAKQDSNARYQQKRRKNIKYGYLVSNENEHIGTNYLSSKPRDNFDDEQAAILKEMKRLKLR